MLKQAYNLLDKEYHKALYEVKGNSFYTNFAHEKHRHSMQVMGAGNFLIRRIDWLKNKSVQYIDMVQTAVFLHDISRFAEIVNLAKRNEKIDHGIAGAEMLRQTDLFNDVRIWLPIKHHGHLIEALYDDKDYQNITSSELQDEVKRICFIIRDADKIANFNMLANREYIALFLGKDKPNCNEDGQISDIIKQTAFKGTTVPRNFDMTMADKMMGLLSWFFDINYVYSIEFCQRLNIIANLLDILKEICADNDFCNKYSKYLKNYIANHNFLK